MLPQTKFWQVSEHTVCQFNCKVCFLWSKPKEGVGVLLIRHISFPQQLHPKAFRVVPTRITRRHQNYDTTSRCWKCCLKYSNILDRTFQIPNTVNSMKHPLVVLFVPFKHSLSWLCGFTPSCHPWYKKSHIDKNERENTWGKPISKLEKSRLQIMVVALAQKFRRA